MQEEEKVPLLSSQRKKQPTAKFKSNDYTLLAHYPHSGSRSPIYSSRMSPVEETVEGEGRDVSAVAS